MKLTKKWSYGMVGSVLVIGGIIGVENMFFSNKSSLPEEIPLLSVKVSQAKVENIPLTVSALGQIKSAQEIDLRAEQSGYLTAVKVGSGEKVQKGQLLFQIADKDQSAAVASAKAGVDQAQAHFDRIQALMKDGAVSQDELDLQVKNLQQAKALLEQAQKALLETQISAPFSGQVTDTDLEVGSYVNVGDKLIGMVNDQETFVQYLLPSQYLRSAELGQSVSFADPFDKKQQLSAKVTYLSPEVDADNASFLVKATLLNAEKALTPGIMVMVSQTLQADRPVLALSALSVKGDPNGFYVFVVEPDQTSHQGKVLVRRIRIGEEHGSWIEVESGLKPKDWVVVEGQEKIHEGQTVEYQTV